eukprot:1950010-Prymnesium_polylepis.1
MQRDNTRFITPSWLIATRFAPFSSSVWSMSMMKGSGTWSTLMGWKGRYLPYLAWSAFHHSSSGAAAAAAASSRARLRGD